MIRLASFSLQGLPSSLSVLTAYMVGKEKAHIQTTTSRAKLVMFKVTKSKKILYEKVNNNFHIHFRLKLDV